jgi:hypothetical protein
VRILSHSEFYGHSADDWRRDQRAHDDYDWVRSQRSMFNSGVDLKTYCAILYVSLTIIFLDLLLLLSVSYFGDKLNIVNVAGICVVFSGVVLYKIVFHFQKEAKEEDTRTLQRKNVREDVVGKLIDTAYSGDEDDGDLDDSSRTFSPRTVELVDRTNGRQNSYSKMTTETIPNGDVGDALSSPNVELV